MRLAQDEVLHLVGLMLDGVRGVSPIAYTRETIGLALAMEDHGATTFRNGARVSGVLKHPQKLGPEAVPNLKAGLEAIRADGDHRQATAQFVKASIRLMMERILLVSRSI